MYDEAKKLSRSTTWAHWYPHAATIYYDRWQANASVCRPGPELLHKITYGELIRQLSSSRLKDES